MVNFLLRKRQMKIQKIVFSLAMLLSTAGMVHAQSTGTQFTNQGSITNTRHNLTQQVPGLNASMMDQSRNNYGEVCVYCHTPHGADATVKLPLWNRTTKATTYKIYSELKTSSLTQTVTQPGVNSLSCLSCHDGQTAMDSIINMPGSGRYLKSQATATETNATFLNEWPSPLATDRRGHHKLNNPGCLACHNGVLEGVPDFQIAALGTDLTNDHPIGITFPSANGTGTDFNTPTGVKGATRFFDADSNSAMDSGDVRLYDAKVECATCHDPHGVPSAGPGSTFKPTFMRVVNTGSKLCLTCHVK